MGEWASFHYIAAASIEAGSFKASRWRRICRCSVDWLTDRPRITVLDLVGMKRRLSLGQLDVSPPQFFRIPIRHVAARHLATLTQARPLAPGFQLRPPQLGEATGVRFHPHIEQGGRAGVAAQQRIAPIEGLLETTTGFGQTGVISRDAHHRACREYSALDSDAPNTPASPELGARHGGRCAIEETRYARRRRFPGKPPVKSSGLRTQSESILLGAREAGFLEYVLGNVHLRQTFSAGRLRGICIPLPQAADGAELGPQRGFKL